MSVAFKHQDPGPGRKSLLPLPDVVQESRLCGGSAGPFFFRALGHHSDGYGYKMGY